MSTCSIWTLLALRSGAPAASLVKYVQVGVTGYNIPLIIPGLNITITSPPFTVTLPAESLGLVRDPVLGGVVTPC